ncbi:uncharacterized protein LOC120648055 [Panicum virgatum]|uniref:uncharacterized protein LOC120648055 n=1 Tax=Panicum virgatum TaxID=38727 RepID=UPI0019D5018E|nr:uncharacterized protein LOC120648055 [Panicum virgatum]
MIDSNEGQGGNDASIIDGWKGYNNTNRLQDHVGSKCDRFHNTAVKRCDNLLKPDQSIGAHFNKQSNATKENYIIRLTTSIKVVRYLLHQGLTFRCHDESQESTNKGNFLELIQLLAEENDKEQMAVVVWYVDKLGVIKERLIGIVHVKETSASCLKSNIDNLFTKYGLSLKQVRGQGYDGASNMREFNDRSDEVNSKLLTQIASFNPKNSFDAYKFESLMELAQSYPKDFDSTQLKDLARELPIYIDNVRADERFAKFNSISELGRMMVQTTKHLSFPLVSSTEARTCSFYCYRIDGEVLFSDENCEDRTA